VIDKVSESIGAYWAKLFTNEFVSNNSKRALLPKNIYKYRSLFGKFTRKVKAACYASGLGYDYVSNYVIGAMRRKVIDLADGYLELVRNEIEVDCRHFRQMFFFLLDVSFYFFTLHPTVASSFRLSHSLVRAAQHLKQHDSDGFDILKEASLRWTSQLARAPSFESLFSKNSIVPIEILNILISLEQFSDDGKLAEELIALTKLDRKSEGYFELVVKLFIYGNRSEYNLQRDEIWEAVCKRIISEKYLSIDSETVHLLLDALACPHIDPTKRAKLLVKSWKRMGANMSRITEVEAKEVVLEIQQQHWFVRWDGIDLLNMIEKKELSSVYS